MTANIEDLFKACDTRGTGYLEQDELRELCSRFEIAGQDADTLFEDLDCDKDGRISFEDFSKGFSDFDSFSTSFRRRESLIEEFNASRGLLVGNGTKKNTASTSSSAKTQPNRKEMVHTSEAPIIEELLEDMRRLQEENKKLESNWLREKREHELHLHRLEEEIDNQVKEVEFRATVKAKEEAEAEKKSLKVRMDAELNQMQANLLLFEKMDNWLKSNKDIQQDEKYQDIRQRLDASSVENRQLRMSLLDTQTNVALMRTELAQLRTQYEEKCRELTSERERVLEALHEQEHMTRQVSLLHDANRRLQDTNDTLRVVLETNVSPKLSTRVNGNGKRGSIIGNYIGADVPGNINKLIEINKRADTSREFREGTDGDLWEEDDSCVESYRQKSEDLEMANFRMQRFVKDLVTRESIHSDSGHSTMRDVELEESDVIFDESEKKPSFIVVVDEFSIQTKADSKQPNNKSGSLRSLDLPSRQTDYLNDGRNYGSLPRSVAYSEGTPRTKKRALLHQATIKPVSYEPTGPPQRTYKVIFIGDAAVGKSSFIMRLSRGVFVQNLSSTLGVDFQMKTLLVDNKNIALQLWDTAGQERFRSMTQSYFRKADGIMLLFDVSSERSFINVREWMQAVEDGVSTPYRLPVLLVANKIDLREVAMLKGETCVSREEGEKLAKSCDVLYIETSAKHGDNVVEAVAQLTRKMQLNEDREIKASGMQLDGKKSKKKCC